MYQNIHFKKHHLKPWGLEIVNKYPLIFLEDDSDVLYYAKDYKPEERVNLRFGFEHEEGWKELVEKLADTGTKLVEYLRKYPNWPDGMMFPESTLYIHGFICKEKLGGLRWQGSSNLPEPFVQLWQSFVRDIETQSYHTCEITGQYGQLCVDADGGWLKTLCEKEMKDRGYTPYAK